MVWRKAEVVVAKCAGEAEMIRAVDGTVPIELVPNGVDLETFTPGEAIPGDGPLRLLCVGRLIERKGQHHLIEAVKRLTDEGLDVTLDLVGTGDAQGACEAMVRDLALDGRVRFAGYVPRKEMPAHYATAHVFVLSSYNEGMSVATLEAMAAGLPIVATRTGGTDEMVEEGINGFAFDWADVGALVAHLRHVASDRWLARKMGAASRSRSKDFSWDGAALRYCHMLADLTGTHGVPFDIEWECVNAPRVDSWTVIT